MEEEAATDEVNVSIMKVSASSVTDHTEYLATQVINEVLRSHSPTLIFLHLKEQTQLR